MANKFLFLRTLNSPFVGNAADITKNSVLSHNDVDNNFIFLKGEDILTGSTSGSDLILNKVNSDTISIDLSSLISSQDNYTTGGTLTNNEIVFNRTNSLSAYTIDLSNLVPNVDYGNIIFVSESGNTTETRTNVIGNINKPVTLERASQIAQSGDTIHVKSGIYNTSITGITGLSVIGVNHYFEPNSKVYKTTTGPMFSKFNGSGIIGEANVYGHGSFYGSDSCGPIFYNFGVVSSAYTQVYEWDVCENSSNDAYYGLYNGHTLLNGKRKILSTSGRAINNNPSDFYNLTVNCPDIESTTGAGIYHLVGGGTSGKLVVNASNIIGTGATNTGGGIVVANHSNSGSHLINASYVNYVYSVSVPLTQHLILNVGRIDELTFSGRYLKVNGHLGWLNGAFNGIADINLIDRSWAAGRGVINTTLNGDFNITSDRHGTENPSQASLVSSLAGNITANYRLQKPTPAIGAFSYDFVEGWFIATSGGSTLNMLGNWDIQDTFISQAGGRLNIPSGTVINIGPKKTPGGATFGAVGETFGFGSTDVNIGGTIVERCDPSAPCDTSQSAHTYSNTLMLVRDWDEVSKPTQSTRVVYNGATIIVRDQNSQILTTQTNYTVNPLKIITGGTVGIYSGGLNTNKMNSFVAEKEKIRVLVSGGTASYTVSGGTGTFSAHTFTTTTGTTAAQCALELTSLTNASSTVKVTASQDTSGVDEYFYLESDVAGYDLMMTYNTKTAFGVTIRYNTHPITDIVGGMLIEDEDIIKDQYN